MSDLLYLLPEIFLLVTVLGVVLSEIGYHGERHRLLTATAIAGLLAAFIQTLLSYRFDATQFLGATLSMDGLSLFFKLIFITLGALTVWSGHLAKEIAPRRRAEFFALVLGSVLVMGLAAAAADVLLLFLCVQVAGIFNYLLSSFARRAASSTEAGVKFLVFTCVSGAFSLLGAALLFAHAHTLNIYEIHRVLAVSPLPPDTALTVFIFVFLGLAMQMAVFPMHFWAPDAIEGSPTPVSGFVAAGYRAMGFAVAVRFFIVIFGRPSLELGKWQTLPGIDWPQILAISTALTLLVGALLSIRQSSAKRLVGYLTVAQGGFYLMGVLVLDEVGIAALFYNLVVDLFALSGIFYVLAFLKDRLHSDQLGKLGGAMRGAVPESVALIFFLACLAGLPPTPGFIGKFALIGAALRRDWHFLALIAIMATGLSTVAAARLAHGLIGRAEWSEGADVSSQILWGVEKGRRAFLAVLLVPIVLLGIFADAVLGWASQSLQFIFW